MISPLLLPSATRFALAIACIRVCAFNGLSRYKHDKHFTSNPVNHIAHTKTIRSGFLESLNSLSNSRFSIFSLCGLISKCHSLKVWISFCSWLITTAISVSCIHFSFRLNSCASCWLAFLILLSKTSISFAQYSCT